MTGWPPLSQLGSYSSEQLLERVEAALAHHPELRAFTQLDLDGAKRRALELDAGAPKGLLWGVPYAAKDNFCTRDSFTTCGSAFLSSYRSPFESFATQALGRAGGLLIGKTAMDEFAMGSTGAHAFIGPCYNPRAPERVAGGSSSGSAAAVAAGIVPFALGSDTGGSVRVPAAYCGIIGFKPSYGRISRWGLVPLANSLDHVGILAHRLDDVALVLDRLAGPDPKDLTARLGPLKDSLRAVEEGRKLPLSRLRIAYSKALFDSCAPRAQEPLFAALDLLAQRGAKLVELAAPPLLEALDCYTVLMSAEAASNLSRLDGLRFGPRDPRPIAAKRSALLGDEVKRRILLGTLALSSTHSPSLYQRAEATRARLSRLGQSWLADVDLLLWPTTPDIAPPMGQKLDFDAQRQLDRFTTFANLSQLPALSLPLPQRDMPLGIQLIGAPQGERALLAHAAAIEAALQDSREEDWAHPAHPRKPAPLPSQPLPTPKPKALRPAPPAPSRTAAIVIGLEIHCALAVESKLFSPEALRYDDAPNTLTHPISLGLPGTLPRLNPEAIEKAVQACFLLGAKVQRWSRFERKHYHYPDLPKGYQITQAHWPLAWGGAVEVDGQSIELERIHLEEDTARSVHGDQHHLDHNRAGAALIEIVSKAQIRSPEQAAQLLRKIHHILSYSGITEGRLEAGQFRCDANISVLHEGRESPRIELKNLNSFRFVQAALSCEAQRLCAAIEKAQPLQQETRSWDPLRQCSYSLRLKESTPDYRYLPEPDLPPLTLTEDWLEDQKSQLPEGPEQARERLTQMGLSGEEILPLLSAHTRVAAFDRLAAKSSPAVAKRLISMVLAKDALSLLSPEQLIQTAQLLQQEHITWRSTEQLIGHLITSSRLPRAIAEAEGLLRVPPNQELLDQLEALLAREHDVVTRYHAGETKVLGYLMGHAMRLAKGRIAPKDLKEVLLRMMVSSQ